MRKENNPEEAIREALLADINLNSGLTALRQGSEWGNRQLTGSYPRMKAMSWCKEDRQRLLYCCVRLNNVRTRMIGRTQLRTYFDPNHQTVTLGRVPRLRDMYRRYFL